MSSALDIKHAARNADAARRCRDLAGALLAGKDRWHEVTPLVRVLEEHIRLSSPERPVAHWQAAAALARVLDCDHRLREAARSPSPGVAEESARLAILLQALDEFLKGEGNEFLRGRFRKVYRLDPRHLDVRAALELLSRLPLPTLYYAEKEDDWRRRRAREEQTETKPLVLKVIAFLDNSPLVCPQVLRPGLMYSLRFRVRGSSWPAGATSLRLDLVSTCPAGSYALSPFGIARPDTDGEFEADANGHITFFAAQSPGSHNLAFTVRCRFEVEGDAGPDVVVVGHHRMQFRVGDLSRLTITSGYRRMDARVLELVEGLERSTPAAASEFPDLLPVLEAVASFLGVYSQRGVFKGSNKVSEKEFQQHVTDFMRMKLGEEVQEHGNQAGGIIDIRFRGVIVELKVEKDDGDRGAITRKYTAQATQYEGSEGRQVAVLLVLDLTEKTLPPGDIRNDILLADVPTHGGTDSGKPHPSKSFVFVLSGNIRSPSDYS